jgi:hypothetical protein
MDSLSIIREFVRDNRKEMAGYVRRKMLEAGAKDYLGRLGKDGIAAIEREAAGVVLDFAVALLNRLNPEPKLVSEEILAQLPPEEAVTVRLPRSDAYHGVLASLQQMVAKKDEKKV